LLIILSIAPLQKSLSKVNVSACSASIPTPFDALSIKVDLHH
jgi:hypothetical protein